MRGSRGGGGAGGGTRTPPPWKNFLDPRLEENKNKQLGLNDMNGHRLL